MAYSARYVFRFGSRNGTDYRITISQDGYSGEALVRHLGGAPVLRRDRSGHIWGTSLEIPAECAVDTEFAALYTSNPKEFLVTLDRSNAPSLERVTVWTGYISTELYSEPDIAPPYDVHIVATDCLGELKTTAFVGESRTLKAHLEHILAKTGLSLPIRTASALAADSVTADNLMSSVVVDYSYLDGKTDYEVLQTILSGINAEITRQGDAWIIFRQTDISSLEGTSRTGERLVRLRNITSGTGTSAPISAVTSMQQGNVWPVGRLSSVVDPARSHGVIRAPYHVVGSALDNPDMDSNAAWSTSGNALWEMDEDGNGWYRLRKDDDLTSSTGGSISQEIPIDSPNYTLRLLVKARMSLPSVVTEGESSFSLFAHISMECKDGNDNDVTIHFGNRVGTFTHYPSALWTDSNAFYGLSVPAGSHGTESDLTEFEIFIPFSAAALGSYHDPTSLKVTLEARAYDRYTIISHCSLSAADVADGEQATIYLDNGARGEADAVELGMSDTIDYAGPQSFFQGFPSIAGSTASLWSTGLLEGDTYLNTMAKDYAMGWALPRLRKEGSLNVPRNSAIPLFAESGEIDYIIETFQWDLLDDELNMSMVSLPAASLEVESIETAQYVTGSTGGAGGSSSNTSMAQTLSGYATLADLSGYALASDLAALAVTVTSNTTRIAALEDLFEIDTETGAIRTKHDRPFYSNSWISAFGISSSGGGGGGGDTTLAGVWESLTTNTDAYANEKISISHIPAFTVTSSGTGNVVSGMSYSNGVFTLTKTQVSTALADLTGADDLRAIEALDGTGLLRRIGTNSWQLDSNSYALASDLTALAAIVTSNTSRITALEDLFEIDTTTGAIRTKHDRPFYSNSWISAFGISSSGGGGGDTTLAGVWESLTTNTDSYANEKIDIHHIPAFTVASSGTGNVVAGMSYSNGVFTLTKTTVSSDWNDITNKPSLVTTSDLNTILADYVTDSALSSWSGSSNIDTVGTIETGEWQGTPIANAYLANSSMTIGSATVALGGSSTLAEIGVTEAYLTGLLDRDYHPYGGANDLDFVSRYVTASTLTAAGAISGGSTVSAADCFTVGNGATGTTAAAASKRRIYFGSTSYWLELAYDSGTSSYYLHTNAGFASESWISALGTGSASGGGGTGGGIPHVLLTQTEYDALVTGGSVDSGVIYLVYEDES